VIDPDEATTILARQNREHQSWLFATGRVAFGDAFTP